MSAATLKARLLGVLTLTGRSLSISAEPDLVERAIVLGVYECE